MSHDAESAPLSELDRQHVFHPFTSIAAQQADGPRVMASAKGVWVRDAQGHEYLDAMAGLWCVNAGYGRDEIAEAETTACSRPRHWKRAGSDR